MIRPKNDIEKICRTPSPEVTRFDKLRMDKNEFLPRWPDGWFRDFIRRLKPEHLSVHPEFARLYRKFARALGVPQEDIVVTAGSDGAIKALFEAFVGPKDRVIVPSPTFAMYYVYARIYGAELFEAHYGKDLGLDIGGIMKAVNKRTKLIAIANPNSPTGTVMKEGDLLDIIRKAARRGAVVLIDEAYYPFYGKSMMRFVRMFDNLAVTRSFSKAAGLAGLRVGVLAGDKRLAKAVYALKPMYEITAVSALAAEYVLDNYSRVFEYAKRTREGKKRMADYFTKKGYEVFPGHANFIQVDFGPGRDGINRYLERNGVLFKHSFAHPSLKRFSRFTVGPKEANKPLIDIFERMKMAGAGGG